MKLTRLLVVALLCLGPALAAQEGGQPTASSPESAAEASLPEQMPEPISLTSCSAQLNCPNGGSVSCTGQTSCTVHSVYVSCDGNNWICPGSCLPPSGCSNPDAFCACRAAGGGGPMCALAYCV